MPGRRPERGIIVIRKLAPALVLSALLTLFTATNASAQGCASLTLTTQAQVDAVSCRSVQVSLQIVSASVHHPLVKLQIEPDILPSSA